MSNEKDAGRDDPNLRANIWAFKAWFEKEPEVAAQPLPRQTLAKKVYGDLIGNLVESRLGIQRLEKQIAHYNPNLHLSDVLAIAKSFKESGGQVANMDDLILVIQSSKGQFALPKPYTKPAS